MINLMNNSISKIDSMAFTNNPNLKRLFLHVILLDILYILDFRTTKSNQSHRTALMDSEN